MKKNILTRRIDDLGRIVIPKEIRKVLKIRESDELAIEIDNENIILSKNSTLENNNIFDLLLRSIAKNLKKNIILTDRDKVINAVSLNKEEYLNKKLSHSIINILDKREFIIKKEFDSIMLLDDSVNISYILNPILINGDLKGCIIIFSMEDIINDIDIENSFVVKYFLEKYIEE